MGRRIEANIGLHFSVQGGYAFKSEDYTDDGAMLFRISNAGKGYFDFKDLVYLPTSFYESLNNFSLNEGDIVMGMTGDLGKICKIPKLSKKILLNQRVGRFVEKGQFDKGLLYYYLTSNWIQNSLSLYFAGGAQANISPKQIESVIIFYPESLDEQHHIAEILSTIDEAIDSTQALIDKHEQIKEGMMHDLFTRGVDPETGSLRPHPSDAPELYKDSELGLIPKEWEVDRLGVNVNMVGGGTFRSDDFKDNGIQLIRIGNLYNNIFDIDRSPVYLDITFKNKFNNYLIRSGDIIMSLTGTYGKRDYGFAIMIEKGEYLLNQRVGKFTFNNELIVGEYLHLLLISDRFQNQVFRNVTGTKQGNLKNEDILGIKVGLPSPKEQIVIAERVKAIDQKIKILHQQKQKLLLQKQGLMHDLLSGKVRVME